MRLFCPHGVASCRSIPMALILLERFLTSPKRWSLPRPKRRPPKYCGTGVLHYRTYRGVLHVIRCAWFRGVLHYRAGLEQYRRPERLSFLSPLWAGTLKANHVAPKVSYALCLCPVLPSRCHVALKVSCAPCLMPAGLCFSFGPLKPRWTERGGPHVSAHRVPRPSPSLRRSPASQSLPATSFAAKTIQRYNASLDRQECSSPAPIGLISRLGVPAVLSLSWRRAALLAVLQRTTS